jgi:hypothetical protein
MSRYRIFSLLMVLLLAAGSTEAETSGSLPLLKLAPDARSAALGEAGVAGSRDAMAPFHNPALTAYTEGSQAAFAYSNWILDLTVQTAALLFNYGSVSWGLNVNSFSVPGLERRDLPSDDPIETFSAHDVVGGFNFAVRLSDRSAAGVNVRYIYQQIYVNEAFGLAGDLGAAYKLDFHDITIGAAVRNLGKMQALQSEETPLPTNGAAGLSGTIYGNGDFGLTGMGDVQFFFEDDLRLHAGLEGSWKDHIFLRVGYQTGSELRSYSGGIGLSWNRFGFDYAYQPLAEDFSAAHRFSFRVNF